MTEKREDVNEVSPCPEPWEYDGEYIRDRDGIPITGGPAYDAYVPDGECSRRIVAAINFCREVSTEYLESHGLVLRQASPHCDDKTYYSVKKEGAE